ncbi:phage tail tape measure protein [Riemerella anatipestifer]|uniref:phage tail tape measure protein n=1 Tax=Riemerella anatipestifer TaxID=34085 RepID=UPI00208FB501|nr:phage tail tape measure protein [Riemerella anatipestifer]MCO4303707.1 phage tail tape measure protein [Riemerella anatipestifer]MCO7352110.1 phage tail tape measure protein [Riemerella anatipestifer]MCT6760623.1 phage tail tape measure protein [Riemerella anatipestifer]MCT6764305.1 phage tail tape measure protein [Riemerella anatipestifer]MCT6766338.1 phage tail tape measure protein [Riemerella anatipestifer]
MSKEITTKGVLIINGKQVKNTFNALRREMNSLTQDIKKLKVGSDEYLKKMEDLNKVKQRFSEVNSEIRGVNKTIKESDGHFKSVFSGNIAADFFMNGVSAAMQFGVAVKQRIDELIEIKRTISLLDKDLSGIRLDLAAAKVKAIAETYNKGVDEIMSAVKGLNAQTKDTNKSLELIKKGFESGADASGEMLTQMKEYPTMMKDARVSAEEMIAIMAEAEKMGIYDDKGIDAIKEGMLRIREGTKATQEAMQELGIDTESIYAKIKSGAMTYFDVIKLVSSKLKDLGNDSRITGTAIADIFGGPGEDAGYEYLSRLGEINTNLEEIIASTNDVNAAKKEELEANEKLNEVWVALTGSGSALMSITSYLKSKTADFLSTILNIKKAKLSEEYNTQSIKLDLLAKRLEATNISNRERINIYNQLKTQFPQYFKNLDLERMKHEDIAKAVRSASNEMRKKYQLQALNETIEEKGVDFKDASRGVMAAEKGGELVLMEAMKKIPEFKKIKFHSSDIGVQLAQALRFLNSNKNIEGNDLNIRRDFESALKVLNSMRASKNQAYSELNKEIAFKQKQVERLGLKDVKLDDSPIIEQDTTTYGATRDANLAAKSTPTKKTDDKLKEAKKDLEDSQKAHSDAYNKLLEMDSDYYLERQKLAEKSLEAELAVLDAERSKELNSQRKYQDDILKTIEDLEEKKKNAKSPEAAKNYEKALEKERSLLALHDKIVETSEEAHGHKVSEIKEKWITKRLSDFFESERLRIDKERALDDEAIQKISTMEEAKLALSEMTHLKLTQQELLQIKTLEDAKKALREDADRKMLESQLASLELQKKALEESLKGLTGEAAEKLKKDLDELNIRITQVKGAIQGNKENDEHRASQERRQQLSQVDLLGFSADQWEDMFKNLKTTEGKIKAVQMATQALSNAFNRFAQLQQNLNEREMQRFTKNQDKKRKALLVQLNQGLISQEEYHKGIEALDTETAKKKSEIAHKQAVAEKAFNIANAIMSTALAVTKSLPNIPLSIAVGALGAIQVATIASTPLPEKESFAKGGYTGPGYGSPDKTGKRPAGIVHGNEYVTPDWMLENPVVADTVEWMEAIRTGRIALPKGYADGGFVTETTNPNGDDKTKVIYNQNTDPQLIAVLAQLKETISDIKEDGVEAYIVENAENGRKLQKMIKQFEKIENKNARRTKL